MEKRGSEQLPDRNLVDMRVSWNTKLGGTTNLSVFLDGFNVLNSSTTIGVNSRWGNYRYSYDDHPGGSRWQPNAAFKTVTAIERPRTLRLGARFAF